LELSNFVYLSIVDFQKIVPTKMRTSQLATLEMEEKALQIEACLARDPIDLWELRELALTSGGLLTGELVVIVVIVITSSEGIMEDLL
jgi:hypothetical protein